MYYKIFDVLQLETLSKLFFI